MFQMDPKKKSFKMWAFDVVMHHRICGVDKLTIAAPLSLFKFINFRTLNRTKQKNTEPFNTLGVPIANIKQLWKLWSLDLS